jgi:hypothetical protein
MVSASRPAGIAMSCTTRCVQLSRRRQSRESKAAMRLAHCPPEPIEDLIIAAQPILSAPEAAKPILTPRRRNAPGTAQLLWHRHGEANARKIARREQKQARQKRSRTQFAFWAAVVAELEKHSSAEIAQDERITA